MTDPISLPSLRPVPENIEDYLRDFLKISAHPALEDWLLSLIKGSGHLSTNEDLRWRIFCMIWLAGQFNVDKAWPYLMWFNMNEPVISDHVCELLVEGANELQGHVQLAVWMDQAIDDRLIRFMSEFRNIPAPDNMLPLLQALYTNPRSPEAEAWLLAYIKSTLDNHNSYIRPWRFVTAAWYATCFNHEHGFYYLQQLNQNIDTRSPKDTLSPEDNKLLFDAAKGFNGIPGLMQWIAACPHAEVKTMLREFGHPDLPTVVAEIFSQAPNYDHLREAETWAGEDRQTFQKILNMLEQTNVDLKKATILNLGCGQLASQTLLLSSSGYRVIGVDLAIPPRYLPTTWGQKLKQRKYIKAWQEATASYYETLAQQSALSLRWHKAKIYMADVTRLNFADNSFEIIICTDYLHHTPDVEALLSEAVRVLKLGGVFIADFVPYTALNGAYQVVTPETAWGHLRGMTTTTSVSLNCQQENQTKAALETHFTLEQWILEQDEEAVALLTPSLRAELAAYEEDVLTRKRIFIVAKQRNSRNA